MNIREKGEHDQREASKSVSMSICPACAQLVSDLTQFIFGWGEPRSEAWKEFAGWIETRTFLPAWSKYIKPTSLSRKLWDEFHPENDQDECYKKEDYRGWLRDFFKDLIERSSEIDKKFFSGFEQQGGDPLRCVEKFKDIAGLRTWADVIHALGSIYSENYFGRQYNRAMMGSFSSPLWKKITNHRFGPALTAAMQESPIGGKAQFQTAFRILESCRFLTEDNLSFAGYLEQKGLLPVLSCSEGSRSDPESHLQWRRKWSQSPQEPWEVPTLVNDLTGIGADTFEYILRDLPYQGCLNLFKADSTNTRFITGTSLANHIIPDEQTRSKAGRKEYWEALYNSGSLTKAPIAVINIAIYFALSELEEIELYWEIGNQRRLLLPYEFLPSRLRALRSPNCSRAHR